jgi:hypothetical protein
MIDYLQNIPDDELVCFIDAFDVLLLRPLSEIEEYFNAITKISNKKIVIACDRVKFQTIKVMADYIFDTCKDIAVNTGTYLGKAKDVRDILKQIMHHNMDETLDDQKLLTEYCVSNPDVFYIDQDSIFFLTIENPLNDIMDENIKITNNQLYYMGTRPFFIHANGNGKLDNIIKTMNYPMNDEEISKINDANWKAIQRKVVYYSKFYYDLLMMLIVIGLLYMCIKHHSRMN